jgi:CBS domain-containing protein
MPDSLTMHDCMKREVVAVKPTASVRDAAALLVQKRVGTLPVVDEDGMLVGITSISRIIQLLLPGFVALLQNIDFIKDYGALKTPSREEWERVASLAVADIMDSPIAVEENSPLIRALSVMEKYNLRDLPVVRDGRLVGIASRADIGRAFLEQWLSAANL